MIVLPLGLLVGLVLGLTGAGGGMLAVPALVFGLDWTVAQAAPVALLAVAGAAWLGTLDGLRHGLARYRAAVLMALAATPGASAGLWLAQQLPAALLTVLFALVMIAAAIRLLSHGGNVHEHVLCRIHADSGRFVWTPRTAVILAGFGLGAGLLTGLLGVGGGFVIVPVLVRYTELAMPAAVATSLMVVALTSSLGLILSWLHGNVPDAQVAPLFLAAVMIGMALGRPLSRHVGARASQRGFALLMLVLAAALLARAGGLRFGV